MKIISLASLHPGYACGVASYLTKYKFKFERDFFDYLTVSMKNINEVLYNKNIEFESYEIPKFNIPNNSPNIFVKFKNFNNMISYHDFTEITPKSLLYWKNFYIKYQQKLINDIIKGDTIVFVRFCVNEADLFENDTYLFFNNINRLNPTLNYYFILFTNGIINIPDNLMKNPRFIHLNFRLYNSIYKNYSFNIYDDLINNFDTKCFSDIIKNIENNRYIKDKKDDKDKR